MRRDGCRNMQGFTLIELMIVVAIISILAAVAMPNFLAYRTKSKISAVLGDSQAIRSGLANYATDSDGNLFPASEDINSYDDLRTIINNSGGTLPLAELANFTVVSYERHDEPGDDEVGSYSLRVAVKEVPNTFPGYEVAISPKGVLRCTSSGAPC